MKRSSGDITLGEVQNIIEGRSAWKVVQSLMEKGLVATYENVQELYRPRFEKFVFLQERYSDETALRELMQSLEKAPRQLDLVLGFLHLNQVKKEVIQSELLKAANAGIAQLNALVDKQVFEIRKLEVDRLVYQGTEPIREELLSPRQEEAMKQIQDGFSAGKPVLLKGITGSGKTHLYLQLIKDAIDSGRQALYLLPEIALTAQIVRKIRSQFGTRVGVYHSRFSDHERVEVWRKIQQREVDVVIGARSALMLPFADLGLIVIDEEHDASYKQQDPAPRYHARDAAIYLAHCCKANIVLGSATPSIESFQHASNGKYQLVELTERFGEGVLPRVEIVDTRQALAERKQVGIFSKQLLDAIQASLGRQKQVILFQNRRGYAPMIICATCGWIPHCKYCDVSLTYHKLTDQLHCHYCGSRSPVISVCQACGGTRMSTKSFGTEKIEDDIKKYFPNARVERFDWDALRVKNKYQEIIRAFENRQLDILVGTQMLVKGLDFEHVDLVGVLSADSLLSYPDFRVNERVFQLLEQVSGRAGRKDDQGRVLIQLYNTSHPVVAHVKQHDYLSFYREEMLARREYQYPPFTRLIRLTLKHKNQLTVQLAAKQLSDGLQGIAQTAIFGPAEPSIGRIRNYFLQEILLKMGRDQQTIQLVKQRIKEKIIGIHTTRNLSNVIVQVDVDPY